MKEMTGSDVISVETIEIVFNTSTGLGRYPIFHTCGPLMELPSTYESFSDLSEDFANILSNSGGGYFDIV